MTIRQGRMPLALREAAETAIRYNDDKIKRMEYQIEHLKGELQRVQYENRVNLKVSFRLRPRVIKFFGLFKY